MIGLLLRIAAESRAPYSERATALAFGLAIACILFVSNTPLHAQSQGELSTYSQQLRSMAQSLEVVLEDACCQSGSYDDALLAAGYLEVVEQAEALLVEPADGSPALRVSSLLDTEIVSDLANDVDSPELAESIEAAIARLTLVAAQIDQMDRDDTTARLAQLEEVLDRPEFQVQLSWWERFTRWLSGIIDAYLPESEGDGLFAGAIGRLVGWTLGIVGLIVVVALLAYWLQDLLRGFVASSSIATDAWSDGEFAISAQQARAQAADAAKAGNYRSAVRQLYLSALLTMEEEGAIQYDRSQTNREVLAQVDASSQISSHLRPVISTFDDVWYGVQEPDQETYSEYIQEVDQLTLAASEERTGTPSASVMGSYPPGSRSSSHNPSGSHTQDTHTQDTHTGLSEHRTRGSIANGFPITHVGSLVAGRNQRDWRSQLAVDNR